MKYHFKIHKEGTGYWAECLELEGCRTQGKSRARLEENMAEVLNLFLSEPADSKVIFPLPRKSVRGSNIVAVAVEPKIAFAFYLKRARLKRGLTQKAVADRLGLKNLYSYQRLENAKTSNPELATIVQLRQVFPELSVDDVLAA